jgi:hypothetical protein
VTNFTTRAHQVLAFGLYDQECQKEKKNEKEKEEKRRTKTEKKEKIKYGDSLWH